MDDVCIRPGAGIKVGCVLQPLFDPMQSLCLPTNRYTVPRILIPENLQRSNIGSRKVGDRINIEIDPQIQATVDTVERVMAEREV